MKKTYIRLWLIIVFLFCIVALSFLIAYTPKQAKPETLPVASPYLRDVVYADDDF